MELDNTDKLILNTILDNSRLSYRQIAKKIKVSVATVMHRINRLEKEKMIKKYTTIIDYEKAGLTIPVLIEIKISKGKLIELEKKIASSPNVYSVFDTTGEYDATVIAKFKSTRLMDSFLKKIQTFDFVERTNTKLILNTIKEDQIKL